ncbi:MAG: outer membrane beta-barrel protein [Vicinamibacterales bacterium]
MLRVGPIGVTPRVTLSGGYDSNVLNRADDEREDVVMDLRPTVDVVVGHNRVRLATATTGVLAYFRDYPGQGGMGVNHSAELAWLGNRVRPFMAGTYMNSNDRFSLEIDERARRTEYAGRAGFSARVASKGELSTVVERSVFRFASITDAQGRPLNQNLNRTTDRAAASVGYSYSPFTTVGVTAEARRDQFEAVTRPAARSFRVVPTLDLRAGLITGRAELGLLRFAPQVAGVAAFTGPVAAVGLTYVLRDRTRFAVRVGRDLSYSADAPLAYFLQSGISASIGRAFGERWELSGSWDRQELDYRNRFPVESPAADAGLGGFRVTSSRGQLEFRIRRDLRCSVVAELSSRTAGASLRGFEKLRVFTAIAYGL